MHICGQEFISLNNKFLLCISFFFRSMNMPRWTKYAYEIAHYR